MKNNLIRDKWIKQYGKTRSEGIKMCLDDMFPEWKDRGVGKHLNDGNSWIDSLHLAMDDLIKKL
jgi:hypothetical protein